MPLLRMSSPPCWKPFSTAMPMPSTVAPASLGQIQQAHQSTAVCQEVIDDQDMILCGEELFGDDDIIDLLVGEGLDLGLIVVVIQVDAHGLFWQTPQAH